MIFKAVLIVILTINVVATSSYRLDFDDRIVGGVTVEIEDYPYQISLIANNEHICGGSIFNAKYILTAAHCTDGYKAEELSIRTGSSFRNRDGSIYPVQTIYQHPEYDESTVDYDISILELSSELEFTSGSASIQLAAENELIPVGELATVTGWGRLQSGGLLADQLQAIQVPVIEWNRCVESYSQANKKVTDRMFCAGFEDGSKDACQGDSGGPLVINGILYGIVSWGEGCADPRYPGVYSNIPALRSFITYVTKL